jgi:hypothetical protein
MPRKLPRNIRRVDHHYFHGFCVKVTRRGQYYQRYFRDQGGRAATLQKAVRFRDRLLLSLPPLRKFHMKSRVSKTGVIGVVLRRERTRKGRPVRFYTAIWNDAHGQRRSRTFSVQKYGKEEAFALARETRRRTLEELLRPKRPRASPLLPPRPRRR